MHAHDDAGRAGGSHGHSHPHLSDAAGPLVRLSPSLYWYRDTCNVYLLVRGDRGLLIDFGSGGVLEHLAEAGVREIEWVLHTHHHRDQCQGDHLLAARGVPIAVPEREAALFAETDAFWRLKKIYDNYDVSSIGFTLPRPVPVARTLRDYETFAWRGYDIRVLPTPGHTKGSVTFAAEVDGVPTAFCGDLVAEPGHVHTIHDLQWQYGLPDAVGRRAPLRDAPRRAAAPAALPLPRPPDGRRAGGACASSSRSSASCTASRARCGRTGSGRSGLTRSTSRRPTSSRTSGRIPTRWRTATRSWRTTAGRSFSTTAFPSWDHMAADMRFVEHSLDELKAVAGLRAVDVVIPSHYHDDHLAGLPWLQQTQGTKAWIFENFAEIVSNPAGYNMPCLLPQPIRVDRALPDGGRVSWDRWTFDVFHMPGHTWWALGLFGEIDGTRVAFTGRQPPPGNREPAPRRRARVPEQDARGLDRGRRPPADGVRAGAHPHRPHRGAPRRPEDARGLPRLGSPDRGRLPDAGRGAGRGELRARPELRDPLPLPEPRPPGRPAADRAPGHQPRRRPTRSREPASSPRRDGRSRRARPRPPSRPARAGRSGSSSRCRRARPAATSSVPSSSSASGASARSRRRWSTSPDPAPGTAGARGARGRAGRLPHASRLNTS